MVVLVVVLKSSSLKEEELLRERERELVGRLNNDHDVLILRDGNDRKQMIDGISLFFFFELAFKFFLHFIPSSSSCAFVGVVRAAAGAGALLLGGGGGGLCALFARLRLRADRHRLRLRRQNQAKGQAGD